MELLPFSPSPLVLDAFDKAGLRWRDEPPEGVSYSGAEQTVFIQGMGNWDAAHELAHWLLASPERRCLDEFGGGPGQFTAPDRELTVVLEGDELGQDELLAQALTVALLEALGITGQARRYISFFDGTLELDWKELQRRGILGPGYAPVCLGDPDRILTVPRSPSPLKLPPHNIPWWGG